jgi:hypothetical protein
MNAQTKQSSDSARRNIDAALARGDSASLRRIAADEKDLNDQQRQALAWIADLFDATAMQQREPRAGWLAASAGAPS